MDPAVNPIMRKNENSAKSLGNELTMSLSWVIWPCAPQVDLIFRKSNSKKFKLRKILIYFSFF